MFRKDQVVNQSGERKTYEQPESIGVTYSFCPTCGSTLCSEPYGLYEALGVEFYMIPIGAFNDSELPKPTVHLYAKRRHHWFDGIAGAKAFDEFGTQEEAMAFFAPLLEQ
jgi:hypothetical protein